MTEFNIFEESTRKKISKYIKNNTNRIEVNTQIFEILEGSLNDLLVKKMTDDLGKESLKNAFERRAPINYYKKVIDKMTTIYENGVTREVVGGNDQDQMLVEWYVEQLNLNKKMNANNEAFNAYKYSLLQFSLKDPDPITGIRKPFVRTIPNNEYLVMSMSKVDPTEPDIIILFMEPIIDVYGQEKKIFHVYTDSQFMIIDIEGEVQGDLMAALDQDGVNGFLTDPFVYANYSENLVMPLPQKDDLQMALLIPLNITDLNYAHKFQAFSLFYGIDVDDQKIKIAPNSWLSMKSDPGGAGKPEIGTIKPTIDTTASLSLNSSEISLWLSAKGIRPGAVGNIEGDAFASGISKMIDESDTYESRISQTEEYKPVEAEFWDKLLNYYHPKWVAMGLIENRTIFTLGAMVKTTFAKPQPMRTRIQLVRDLKEEVDAGFKSRKDAMRELYPELNDDELDLKIAEIDAERILELEVTNGEEQVRDEDFSTSA